MCWQCEAFRAYEAAAVCPVSLAAAVMGDIIKCN